MLIPTTLFLSLSLLGKKRKEIKNPLAVSSSFGTCLLFLFNVGVFFFCSLNLPHSSVFARVPKRSMNELSHPVDALCVLRDFSR